MKELLKNCALAIPNIRRIFQERNLLRLENNALKEQIGHISRFAQIDKETLLRQIAENEERYSANFARLEKVILDNITYVSRDQVADIEQKYVARIEEFERNICLRQGELVKQLEQQQFVLDDIRRESFSFNKRKTSFTKEYSLQTDYPVAVNSDDHKFPWGTKNDNTRCPRFVNAIEQALGKNLRVMDIGCSGGGMVLDFALAGHEAIGVEGSNFSLLNQRAEWATIAEQLFTADVSQPFTVTKNDIAAEFDLITAWELLEHIEEDVLPALLDNIYRHLSPNGVFCGSVAMTEDKDPVTGADYHVTIKPREWWVSLIEKSGFVVVSNIVSDGDFPRGSGNPRAMDWDVRTNPEIGFHITFRKRNEGDLA